MARATKRSDLDDLFQRVDAATRTDPHRALTLVEQALARLGARGKPMAPAQRSAERRGVASRTRGVAERTTADAAARARLFRYRAHARRSLNDFAGALDDYRRALTLYRRLGDAYEAAITQIGRVGALMYAARYREALAAARQARRVLLSRGDHLRIARLDSNTGNIYHRWDRPGEALNHYERARRTLARLHDQAGLALVEYNRGTALTALGRLEEAEAAFGSARRFFASTRQELATAETDYGVAYLLLLQGRLTEALAAYDRLRSSLTRLGEKRLLALCDMDSAEAYLRLNLWVEAEERASRAARAFGTLEMRYEQARSMVFQGTALVKTGRRERTLALWRRAADLFRREGNRAWQGVISLNMARLEKERGRHAAASRRAGEALAQLVPPAPPERRAEALAYKGLLDSEAARKRSTAETARRLLLRARRVATASGASWLVRDIEETLGVLAQRWGTPSEARRHLRAAVDAGERLRSLLHGDDFRAAFLRDRSRPYLALAFLDLAEGRVEQAFRWVERGRARALLEGLEGLPRRRGRRREDRRTVDELEAILRRLAVQYHRDAELGAPGARPSPEVARLPDPVRRHLESRAEELIGQAYPECDPAAGRREQLAPPEGAEPELAPDEALISYCELGGTIMAFVRTREGLHVSRDLAAAADVQAAGDRLGYQWGRFRFGGDILARHARLLLDDVMEDLSLLHGLLAAPLTRAREKSTWIVVPSRAMASLPLAALHDGRRFLAESTAVVVAPSSGVFARCRQRLSRRARGTLVVGLAGPSTTEVGREAAAVCRSTSLRPVVRLQGSGATVEDLGRESAGRAVIHLASHGFFHAERPRLSGVRLADRWLHAHDAARMDLSAELVVLSACQSGTSMVLEGDEWMGLPRAFLKAGAARVLASLWDVEDRATRDLMTRFWRAWAVPRRHPAIALRQAQIGLLARNRHPYFWAGFQLVGTP